MLRSVLILTMATLAGCATTCERHPIACSAAAGVVATSIALSASSGSRTEDSYRRPFYELKGSPR